MLPSRHRRPAAAAGPTRSPERLLSVLFEHAAIGRAPSTPPRAADSAGGLGGDQPEQPGLAVRPNTLIVVEGGPSTSYTLMITSDIPSSQELVVDVDLAGVLTSASSTVLAAVADAGNTAIVKRLVKL